jgi:hypothetical protein
VAVFRELQDLARERQQEMLRDMEQLRLHRLAAGPAPKPTKGSLRRLLDRRAR